LNLRKLLGPGGDLLEPGYYLVWKPLHSAHLFPQEFSEEPELELYTARYWCDVWSEPRENGRELVPLFRPRTGAQVLAEVQAYALLTGNGPNAGWRKLLTSVRHILKHPGKELP
jgi:hypothetical protein